MPFLKVLKEREGAKIHFICTSEHDVRYWKDLDTEGLIDSYITINHFFSEYDRPGAAFEDACARAKAYEDKYGIYVTDALQTDRHLGRGFYASGIGHPRSKMSDKATYLRSVNLFNRMIRFWEDHLDKIKPELVIGVSSGLAGKVFLALSRYYKIPTRLLVSSKYKSYYYWAFDEYYTSPEIKRNYDSMKNVSEIADKSEIEGEILSPDAKMYKRFADIRSPWVLLKKIMHQIERHVYRKLKRVVTLGNYRCLENIKYLYRAHRDINAVEGYETLNRNDLSGRSYMFFGLHCEPETALGVMSPEFNEQLALIELVAKNLPAGTVLAVKEHLAAFGRRPKEFYSTIQEIPNTVLVSPYEDAVEVAKTARAVIIITGSLGFEAAINGIPVISFGIHNNINMLPHVHPVESWKELRPLLAKLSGDSAEEGKERRIRDGLRYLAAVKASSIYNKKPLILDMRVDVTLTEEEARDLYKSLMDSVKQGSFERQAQQAVYKG